MPRGITVIEDTDTDRPLLERAREFAVGGDTDLVVLALVAGAVAGQPVLFSFVTSESMSPTIESGDGFIAIPPQLVGSVQEGDVVIFQAQEINDGGLTTHRVIGETDEGYVTRGDNNPFTDQDSGEPPVTDTQIVAVAWQPGGNVLTIPALGTAVLETRAAVFDIQTTVADTFGINGADNTRQVGTMMVVAGVALFFITVVNNFRRRSSRDRTRSREREGQIRPLYVALFLTAIVIIPANAAMLLPSTTHAVSVADIATQNGVEPGDQVELTLSATNSGYVTMLVVFDSGPDVTLNDRSLAVPGRSRASTTMTVPAPPPGQEGTQDVSEIRYILLLPPSVLLTLHDIHPWVALGTLNMALMVSIVTLVLGLVGVQSRRSRETSRDIPLSVRIKRVFR
jgi:signal peptidase